MKSNHGEALSRILSGRAAALGFANATEAGASGILDRVRRGACLACSVSVPVGEPFPPPACGCEGPSRRAEMAGDHAGYVASRIFSGWCSKHATALAKGQHRPKGCAACRAGLPDWAALLAQAQAADFFQRHKIGSPLPLVPRSRGAQGSGPVKPQSDIAAPRGRAVLGTASPDFAALSDADLRAEMERLTAELTKFQNRRALRWHLEQRRLLAQRPRSLHRRRP